jgi:hypothetical protein
MVRTQIQLTERQHRALAEEAKRRGVSMAELVRQWIECHLPSAREPRTPDWERMQAFIGAFEDPEGANLSEEHDRYLAEGYRR